MADRAQGHIDLSGVPEEFRGRVSDDGRELNLADLQLLSVPEWLGNLTALIRLDLSGNRLTVGAGVAGEPDRPHRAVPGREPADRRCRSRWGT